MKKSILVALATILVLGFSACCKDKCCGRCCKAEVTECAQKKAHAVVEPMVESLELTAEETAALEKAFAEKFTRDCQANKCFEEQLKEILGEEKFGKMKEACCPRHHGPRPHCDMRPRGCNGERPEGCCQEEGAAKPCCGEKPEGCCQGEKPEGCCKGEKPEGCCGGCK